MSDPLPGPSTAAAKTAASAQGSPSLPTGTVTFLFTDIQGSTPLWESQPEQMAAALQVHNTVLRGAIETHGGVVFQFVGDAYQAAFPTASQALRAAIEGQKALQAAPWNALGELKVRMGLHTGEAALDPAGDEYAVSHTKNRAARIMSAAHGGQVLLSQETKDLVDHQLPGGVTLKDLGEHRLKGMAVMEHLYQVCAPELVQDFPALSTAVTRPNNLPVQLTSFIGRERETEDVLALLQKNRLVTLTGSGGTGKTRLSLRVAEEALEHFPQGAWFTELAGLSDPELVPRTLVGTLGLVESPSRSLLDQLKEYLKEKQLLIILDNCEHVIADCARIAQTLLQACPKIRILASSREALGVAGEAIYHVPSLPVPDPHNLPAPEALALYPAVQLFAERAAAAHPEFKVTSANAGAVAQVCRRLDGIPLAIELAAARVGALSVEQIASRLDNRFRLLTGGSRTAVPRQQTLRASIDWSYSLLSEAERLLLMRLSVFQGGWTLELASEVCGFDGLDEFDVLDGLTQLMNKSLIFTEVNPDGSLRYRRLETIRQYAREKLLDSGASEVVHDRHLEAFLRLAEAAEPHLRGPQQVEWMDRLELELDNLRAALEWALEGNAQKGLRLATCLYWFWHIRGYRVESETWIRQLLEWLSSQPTTDLALVATAKARQAMLLCAIGQVGPQTVRIAEESLAMAETLGEAGKKIQFLALHAQGWNAGYLGQIKFYDQFFKRCLDIAESIGDRFLIAEALQNLSYAEQDPIKSQKYAERNLALRYELGDLDGLMTAKELMGSYAYGMGDYEQARRMYAESIQTATSVKNRMTMISGNGGMGRVLFIMGELELSIEYFRRALVIAQGLGELIWTIWPMCALGNVYGAQKNLTMAEQYYQQAIKTALEYHSIIWENFCYLSLAEINWKMGNNEKAAQHYQSAIRTGEGQQGLSMEGPVAYARGKLALLRGEAASAEAHFQQALKEFTPDHVLENIFSCLESLVVCALQKGRMQRAVLLAGAITSKREFKDPFLTLWLGTYDLDTSLVPARNELGEEEFTRLYAKGKALTLEQTVALAMEQ